ncbi:hypothetical protein D3C72_1569310 [compost metagenome]
MQSCGEVLGVRNNSHHIGDDICFFPARSVLGFKSTFTNFQFPMMGRGAEPAIKLIGHSRCKWRFRNFIKRLKVIDLRDSFSRAQIDPMLIGSQVSQSCHEIRMKLMQVFRKITVGNKAVLLNLIADGPGFRRKEPFAGFCGKGARECKEQGHSHC